MKTAFGSKKRRMIMVGDDGIVLYAVDKTQATRLISLAWIEPDFETKLIRVLEEKSAGNIVIVYDAVEQHYRKDKIPKVGFADKAKVIQRKLNLAFPNFSTKAALEIKKEKGRGNSAQQPEYLFAALPNSEQLLRVVNVISEVECGIDGLTLLPVESVGFVEEIANRCVARTSGQRSKWTIFIGQNETGGLRQIAVNNGNLMMARLTPVAEETSEIGLSSEIVREFKATLSYVSRLGYNPKDGLDVIILASKESHNALKVSNLESRNLCLLDLPDALKIMGGQYIGEASFTYSDSLYALWVAKKRRFLLPMQMQRLKKIAQIRKIASYGVVFLVLSIVAIVGLTYNSYHAYNESLAAFNVKKTQVDTLEAEHAQESKRFEALPTHPDVVLGVLKAKKMLQNNSVQLSPFLERLSDVLARDFQIESISIDHSAAPSTPIARLDAGGTQQSGGFFGSGNDAEKKRGEITLEFSVFMSDQGLSLETMVLRAKDLLARLKETFSDHNVRLEQQFGGVTSTGAFSIGGGNTSNDDASGNRLVATFKITGDPL